MKLGINRRTLFLFELKKHNVASSQKPHLRGACRAAHDTLLCLQTGGLKLSGVNIQFLTL